jgi:hypothetical protein
MRSANKQAKGPWTCQPLSNPLQNSGTCSMVCQCSSPVAVAAEGRAQVAAREHEARQAVECVRQHNCELRLLHGCRGGWLSAVAAVVVSRRCFS